jgi:hypothetical protein
MKRSLLPTFLVVIGLALIIGCFYLPSFEEPVSPKQTDFRDLVGENAGHPIRPGYVDRKTIVLLLGPPPLASSDGKSIGYLFGTHHGYWVWPLCFAGQDAAHTEYGLRLDFRNDDVLREFKVVSEQANLDPLFFSGPFFPVDSVVDKLNQSGPELMPRS